MRSLERGSGPRERISSWYGRAVTLVDAVVVSYNSREHIRACVEPLARLADVEVIVVDNASADGTLDAIADLPVRAIPLMANTGFAHGCNVGIAAGEAPYVLLLNPDAEIGEASVEKLTQVLEAEPEAGAVAPRIVDGDGHLDFSLRRFPRLRSTFAQALYLHRIFPRASWTDELVRDEEVYARPGSPEWVSGACLLLRRTALERLGGLDDGFFMYSEDVDLCKRLQDEGFRLRFVPDAIVVHEGGASAPRSALLPVLAASKIRYARKHRGPLYATMERVGVGLGALARIVVSHGGVAQRVGHARSLRAALGPVRDASGRTARRA
jgi:N-acetylglucosaminyl-diphospho-decaprenol L-rhamnosyltransferase